MTCITRCANVICVVAAGWFLAVPAYADKLPEGFIALHGSHSDVRGKTATPMRNSPAAFMPLNARSYQGLPPKLQKPVETVMLRDFKPQGEDESPHASGDLSSMSREEAQQIISIFAPDQ